MLWSIWAVDININSPNPRIFKPADKSEIPSFDDSEIRRSPVVMENILVFIGLYTFQVVQDFFQQ